METETEPAQSKIEITTPPRVLHCWESYGDRTCLLHKDHGGPHEWTPNDEIIIHIGKP